MDECRLGRETEVRGSEKRLRKRTKEHVLQSYDQDEGGKRIEEDKTKKITVLNG